jgi:uncharacterized protein (DUF302 family)
MEGTRRFGYGFGRLIKRPYAEVVNATREALKSEGFGVLCEIDVQRTLKEKLGVERTPYVILGACNPPLAHRALEAEPDLGLLLPCNVVVYETAEGTWVEAMDPEPVLGLVGNPALPAIAAEVKAKLERVVEKAAKGG